MPGFNFSALQPEEYPTMAIKLGGREWLAEVADSNHRINCQSCGAEVFSPSAHADEWVKEMGRNQEINIPSISGATFWNHLKGLVFHFTAGQERVGFVPRMRLMNKNGILNPLEVPRSLGARSMDCKVGRSVLFALLSTVVIARFS